jgi:hypothetical protein
MDQRTKDWHEARKGKVNASEAGGLLGISKYKSAKQARKEWVARQHGEPPKDLSGNPDVRRGVELEPPILDKLETQRNTIIHQDGGREWGDIFRASADGWYERDDGKVVVVEVKAPRAFFKWDDRPDYLLQALIQCHAYGADGALLGQGVINEEMELQVEAQFFDISLLHAIVQQAVKGDPVWLLQELHGEMVDEEPEQVAEASEEFTELQDHYLIAKRAMDDAKKVLDEVKARLLAACENQPVKGDKLQVVEATRQGAVDWRKVQAELGVDLDQYRGKPSIYLTVRETK